MLWVTLIFYTFECYVFSGESDKGLTRRVKTLCQQECSRGALAVHEPATLSRRLVPRHRHSVTSKTCGHPLRQSKRRLVLTSMINFSTARQRGVAV